LQPIGPVASLESIKQLFTNGGGWYNVNSAHPFENPTPLTNFLELLAIIVVPMSPAYQSRGRAVADRARRRLARHERAKG
jgi:potassium-transporting ATPase potassium-binding subunit